MSRSERCEGCGAYPGQYLKNRGDGLREIVGYYMWRHGGQWFCYGCHLDMLKAEAEMRALDKVVNG